MGNVILIIILLIVLSSILIVKADSTFFDNENDVFIMGNSPTTDSGVTGEATGGGGCRYEWNCTDWNACLPYGKQNRNCTNIGTCSDGYKTPQIEQNCTYITPEENKELEKENLTEEQTPEYLQQKPPIFQITIFVIVIILIGIFYYFIIKKSKKK